MEGGREGGGKQSWGRPLQTDIAPGIAPAQSIHDGKNGLVRECKRNKFGCEADVVFDAINATDREEEISLGGSLCGKVESLVCRQCPREGHSL